MINPAWRQPALAVACFFAAKATDYGPSDPID